jgi:hypothetical protein
MATARNWKVGDNGLARWDHDCRYVGNFISQRSSPSGQCGGLCIANFRCTHFSHGDGACFMYSTPKGKKESRETGWTCGFIDHRIDWGRFAVNPNVII